MDWFTYYVAVGAILAPLTVYKVKRLTSNPLAAMPFNAALMFVPRRSERVLFAFIGAIVLFAWLPVAAGYIYEKHPKAVETLAVAFMVLYALATLWSTFEDALYNPGHCAEGPLINHVAVLLLFVLGNILLYIIYKITRNDKKEEPAPEGEAVTREN